MVIADEVVEHPSAPSEIRRVDAHLHRTLPSGVRNIRTELHYEIHGDIPGVGPVSMHTARSMPKPTKGPLGYCQGRSMDVTWYERVVTALRNIEWPTFRMFVSALSPVT